MNILAIIPARGGSKGIPMKNITMLAGRPLISFSIEKALESKCFCDVVVSSDSEAILSCARAVSEDIIALARPSNISTDHASSLDVVKHALEYYRDFKNCIPDAVFLLQPTSPIRKVSDIIAACELFRKSNKNSLISVSEPMQHPSDFIFRDNDELRYCFARDDSSVLRRQDFVESLFINGSIYISDTQFLLKNEAFYTLDDCALFMMSMAASIDIDTPLDLCIAEAVLSMSNKN